MGLKALGNSNLWQALLRADGFSSFHAQVENTALELPEALCPCHIQCMGDMCPAGSVAEGTFAGLWIACCPLLSAGVSGACQFPSAHTRQCPMGGGGQIMSVLSCLPFIGHKEHFS